MYGFLNYINSVFNARLLRYVNYIYFDSQWAIIKEVCIVMVKIGYVRISRDTQDSASQVKLMEDKGIKAVDIYIDSAVSGGIKPESRPVFKEMLKRIDDKKDVDEILFSEFSRIGRTVDDSLMTLIPLKQRGITIRSLSNSESFINELPGEMQTWVISGMLFAASMEKKHNNERTKWGIEAARANGKVIGRPIVKVDFQKIKNTMDQYNLKEKQAVRVCNYSEATFYKSRREHKEDYVKIFGERKKL